MSLLLRAEYPPTGNGARTGGAQLWPFLAIGCAEYIEYGYNKDLWESVLFSDKRYVMLYVMVWQQLNIFGMLFDNLICFNITTQSSTI